MQFSKLHQRQRLAWLQAGQLLGLHLQAGSPGRHHSTAHDRHHTTTGMILSCQVPDTTQPHAHACMPAQEPSGFLRTGGHAAACSGDNVTVWLCRWSFRQAHLTVYTACCSSGSSSSRPLVSFSVLLVDLRSRMALRHTLNAFHSLQAAAAQQQGRRRKGGDCSQGRVPCEPPTRLHEST